MRTNNGSLYQLLTAVKVLAIVRIMPTADIGPTGQRVAQNAETLRGRIPLRELSDRLAALGRPILASGLVKLGKGERRVDVDDLVALALALGVNPNRLLLPVKLDDHEIELTPEISVMPFQAWQWADGKGPLLAASDPNAPVGEVAEEFARRSRPVSDAARRQHSAVQAARDVMDRLDVLLADRAGELAEHPSPSDVSNVFRRIYGDPPDALRRALTRLVAEVEDLVGTDDGR